MSDNKTTPKEARLMDIIFVLAGLQVLSYGGTGQGLAKSVPFFLGILLIVVGVISYIRDVTRNK